MSKTNDTLTVEIMKNNIRRISVENIDFPEWGTFGIMEIREYGFEVSNGRNRIYVSNSDIKFWRIAKRSIGKVR